MKLIQSINLKRGVIGIVGLLLSVFLITFFPDIVVSLIHFLESHLAHDHSIDHYAVFVAESSVVFFTLLLFTFSICILLNINGKLLLLFTYFFQMDQAIKFFCTDNICSKKRFSGYTLVIGIILGLIIYFSYLVFGERKSEGLAEMSSSSLFLFSAIILIISSLRFNRLILPTQIRTVFLFLTLTLSLIFLIIFGEEISWGQQIFHWKSAHIFDKYGFQDETNFHNFFNPLFKFIYPSVGMSSFLILFFIWFFPIKKKSYLFDLFIPHPSLFFLAFLMASSSFTEHREIYEELLALFSLLYSIRILTCLSFPTRVHQERNGIIN